MHLNPEFSQGNLPPNPQPQPAAEKFPLGQVCATANAAIRLTPADIQTALRRHHVGDWGDLDPDDRQANEDALKHEGRLLSVYHATDGTKFYVITEWDRSITTILLPEDY